MQLFPGFQSPFTTAPFAQAAWTGAPALAGLIGSITDPDVSRSLSEWSSRSAALGALQSRYYQDQLALWAATVRRERGHAYTPVIEPDGADRRFSGAAWREEPQYDFIKQSYLLHARFLREAVEAAEVDERTKSKLRFFTRQYIDAISPANFIVTNPEVLRAAIESDGRTLALGLRNLIADVEKGRISTTDESAFEVGRNLAATPGAVIFENELFQLIQYAPATETVHARPLVMIPPCINKYYILDLSTENSFVRFAVENGHTVFMVSWRNPVAEQGGLTWDDYVAEGVIRALAVAREVAKADRVNALGFCVGGTLAASALAVLAARGEDWVESLTLLTTLLDYEDTGEIGLLVDEAGVAAREQSIGAGGILPGRDLAMVFSTLRANDLVWNYVVDSYLKGRTPPAFDILYWNADSTNLPGPMYCYYVRNMYLENRLPRGGALEMCGEKVDLARLKMPAYMLASREDHIVPWRSAFRSTRLLKGDIRFVLAASGHIAGVINPLKGNRRSHWTNPILQDEPDAWFSLATEHRGSWWGDWAEWVGRVGGGRTKARKRLGGGKYRKVEPAPGRYVKHRIV